MINGNVSVICKLFVQILEGWAVGWRRMNKEKRNSRFEIYFLNMLLKNLVLRKGPKSSWYLTWETHNKISQDVPVEKVEQKVKHDTPIWRHTYINITFWSYIGYCYRKSRGGSSRYHKKAILERLNLGEMGDNISEEISDIDIKTRKPQNNC